MMFSNIVFFREIVLTKTIKAKKGPFFLHLSVREGDTWQSDKG